MTPEQRKLARAALGLPNDRRRSYRNRFFTPKTADNWPPWAALCDEGLATFEQGATMDFFSLTRTGAEQALERGESLDLEDFPHD